MLCSAPPTAFHVLFTSFPPLTWAGGWAGGDWGAAISSALGGIYPQHCRAIHINLCFAQPSYTNPWHVAQLLNARLPVANWFPLTISYEVSPSSFLLPCRMGLCMPLLP